MSYYEFEQEFIREIPSLSGKFFIGDEWIPRYKRIRDLTFLSDERLPLARRATQGGFADGQTVFAALGRAVRVVDACQEVGAAVNNQWVLQTPARSYQFLAASLAVNACLPFDTTERSAIRDVAAQALAPEPFALPDRLQPLFVQGQRWLAAPDPGQPGFGENPYSGSCYYFDRAQAMLAHISDEALWITDIEDDMYFGYDWEERQANGEYDG